MPAANTEPKQRGRPFEKGKSGNPNGRPQGSRNKATLACQELLDGEAEALARKAVDMALGGDIQALRLCLDRIVPPRKERAINLDLPEPGAAESLEAASSAVLMAVAAGDITPGEGQSLTAILEGRRKVLELTEIERRLSELEQIK